MGILEPDSNSRKAVQLAFSLVTCFLTAGLIFGFAALKSPLVHEGIYEKYCDSDADRQRSRESGLPCIDQDLRLNLGFTISIVVNNLAALPIGILLDKVGPQKTSLLGALLFGAGNFTMGLKETQSFDPFLTGYLLLAIGGPMLFLSSFHMCNTFPKHSGLILSAITGAFDASSLPFVVYNAVYMRFGVHLRTWFWAYMSVPAIIFVQQLLIGPKQAYNRFDDFDESDGKPVQVASASTERTPLLRGDSTVVEEAGPEDEDLLNPHDSSRPNSRRPSLNRPNESHSRIFFSEMNDPSLPASAPSGGQRDDNTVDPGPLSRDPITGLLWGRSATSQIFTLLFWIPQLFLTIHMLRINYYIATVYDQIAYFTEDPHLARDLTNAFTILLPLAGLVSIPFIGFLLDKRSSKSAITVLALLGIGFGMLSMVPSAPAQVGAILFFVVMRPTLYTALSDYYTKIIGIETFGRVYGLSNSLSGLFGLLQYPIDYLVKRKLNGNYVPINVVLLLLGAISAGTVILLIHQRTQGATTKRRYGRGHTGSSH